MLRGIFLIIGASVLPVSLNAQPAGWNYAKPYVVTNSASALTLNYQLKMTINTQALVTAGQMQASGNDIRFGKNCSGSVLYNYWIESGMNTTATIIWVKIDSLPSLASKTMFMFYGNATAPAVSSIPLVFNGPHSASDSVASGGPGGLANSQRGFHFIPLEDLLVTSFGKREPTGSLRYVTLFDVSTQAVIVQRQISGPAAQYSYQPLTNAIWITQGIHYVIVLYSGASDGYYFGISNQSGQHVQYVETLYCNGCTQNTFPNIPLPGYHYGYADLLYWTKTTITPAPLVTEGTMAPLSLATSADVSICAGDSTQLTGVSSGGTGEYTFSWTPSVSLSAATNDTTFAFPVMNTTYTLTVADSLGCIATDNVTVTVNTLPSVTFNFPFDSLCVNAGIISLSGGMPAGGNFSGPGVSGSDFDASAAGTGLIVLYYNYADANGCVGIAADSIYLALCTSVASPGQENIRVYPNPFTNTLNIRFAQAVDSGVVLLNNLQGQLVASYPTSGAKAEIDFSGVENGVYLLQIITEEGSYNFRVIKE